MNLEYLNFENYLENLGDTIGYYITIIIVPIGILLNLKTAFLFSRKNLNKTNMGFFYFWTSILFMFTLAYNIFFIKSKLFFNYDLSKTSDTLCQITTLFKKAIRSMPPWLLVITTIERYLNLKYTNKINKNNKKIYLFGLFAFISAALFAVNISSIYFGLTYTFSSNSTNNSVQSVVTKIKCTATNDILNISDMITGVFRLIIPSLLIILVDLLIMSHIALKLKLMSMTNKRLLKLARRENHYALVTVFLGFLFALFNLPIALCYIVQNVYINIGHDRYTVAILYFIWERTYDISNLYYSLFFIMNLVFNSLLRREFVLAFSFSNRVHMTRFQEEVYSAYQ